MDRGGFLCEGEARMILKQIILGLAALKQKTVMHRDLKLPNIMLHFSALRPEVWTDPNHKMKDFRKNFDFSSDFKHLKCKIADLGFARKCEEDDLAQTGCGTPLLMAPEVLMGKKYDHKADVWSIGCLYYELLTGFKPFTAQDRPQLRDYVQKGDYALPKSLKISLAGCKFIDDCLRYNPNDRISWQELQNHVYLESDLYEQTVDDFYVPHDPQIAHNFVQNPYYWINKNKSNCNWLNCANPQVFEKLYEDSLKIFMMN